MCRTVTGRAARHRGTRRHVLSNRAREPASGGVVVVGGGGERGGGETTGDRCRASQRMKKQTERMARSSGALANRRPATLRRTPVSFASDRFIPLSFRRSARARARSLRPRAEYFAIPRERPNFPISLTITKTQNLGRSFFPLHRAACPVRRRKRRGMFFFARCPRR